MNTDNFNSGLKKLLTFDSIRLTKIGILIQHILLYSFFTFIFGLILNDIMPEYDKTKSKIIIVTEVIVHLIFLSFFLYYLRIIVMIFPFIIKINNFDSSRIDISILYSEIIIIVIMVIATQMKLIKKLHFLFKSLNKQEIENEENNLDYNNNRYLNLNKPTKDIQDVNNQNQSNSSPKIESFSFDKRNDNNVSEGSEDKNFKTLISKIRNNIQALDVNSDLKFTSLDKFYNHYNQPKNKDPIEYFDIQNKIRSQNYQNNSYPIDNIHTQDINYNISPTSFKSELSDRFLNNNFNNQSIDFIPTQLNNGNSNSNNYISNNDRQNVINETKQISFLDKKKNQIEDYFESNLGHNKDYETKVIPLEKFKNSPLQPPSYDNLLKDIH